MLPPHTCTAKLLRDKHCELVNPLDHTTTNFGATFLLAFFNFWYAWSMKSHHSDRKSVSLKYWLQHSRFTSSPPRWKISVDPVDSISSLYNFSSTKYVWLFFGLSWPQGGSPNAQTSPVYQKSLHRMKTTFSQHYHNKNSTVADWYTSRALPCHTWVPNPNLNAHKYNHGNQILDNNVWELNVLLPLPTCAGASISGMI